MAHTTTIPLSTTTIDPSATHPNPTPITHHRKIELQSHADLTYLQQNLAKAVREKLDLHFPPIHSQSRPAEIISLDGAADVRSQKQQNDNKKRDEGGKDVTDDEDPMRAAVRRLVDQFLARTYTTAAHSISVNGIDATSLPTSQFPSCSNPTPSNDPVSTSTEPGRNEPPQELEGVHFEYTPFDPRLQKRVQELYGELQSLTTQVSKLRREAPRASADAHAALLQAQSARDEEMWEVEQERLRNETYDGMELEEVRQGWNEDLRSVYARGVQGLALLSGVVPRTKVEAVDEEQIASLTETVGKAQRARDVANEIE